MRIIFFYLACFLLIWKMLDYHQFMGNAAPTTLSRLTPPMDYFSEFVDREGQYDNLKLLNCVYYHQAVAHFFAYQKAEAYGMLGFCYERLGQQDQAVASYNKAIASNPDYFWPYYDLGVISYNHAKYAQAVDYFQQAIEQSPLKTVVFLSRSKVYNDVRLSKKDGRYDFLEGLQQGRLKAYILLMDSLYKSGSYVKLLNTALYGLKENFNTQGIFYYYAGMAAFFQKSFPNAMSFLQASVQIDPTNPDAFYYLGLCLRLASKEDVAGILMARAASLHLQGNPVIKQYLKARVQFF